MKRFVKSIDMVKNDAIINGNEAVEVDIDTYDSSKDPDDTIYTADSVEEMLRWLNREERCATI